MNRHGWRLLAHPRFFAQYESLLDRVAKVKLSDPVGWSSHPAAKLLITIRRYILEAIPNNPSGAEFRQGNTLGAGNRHWFRAKIHQRYRLFYRFSSEARIIVYVWINDESSLRKTGSKRDPYAVFRAMLESGDPPDSFEDLLRRSKAL